MENTSALINMSLTSLLLAGLLLVTTATASHFYGGSMTFNPRRNSDGSYKVELRFKTTYHYCYDYDYWPCSSGDCGNDVSTVTGQVDSSPNGDNWCQSEGVIIKRVPTAHSSSSKVVVAGSTTQSRILETGVFLLTLTSEIVDVIISGPLNSTKYKTTTGEYVINWTPTAENYGQHFPFCFIAEVTYGSDIYHSEMRCIVVKVNAEGPVAQVTCTQNSMSVTVERSSIKNLHGDHLRLINQSCQVYTNNTHLFTTTLLNDCGTQIEENNNELIFKNKIVTFNDPRNIITRKDQLEIEILCKYQKRRNVTIEFDTHRPPVIISERGFGTFNYQFEFYASQNFQNMRVPESYPLEYNVGDKIYMKIEPVTPVPNTEIFLESCVATPYDNPSYPISYPIIKNG
ncbi:CUB and zona pellucida-like domain-containing 1 [Labeo rohita]|uniref:CUB and zona pellucida-like domain-containing 1 n=1 Tax=Labeo rohita TaxID=84645 RepID=A0A498M233_LABRO|nr:CUB and zona pellucida-like domain-containing 1 [Labeo rohita]